jgi:hypothetical protein
MAKRRWKDLSSRQRVAIFALGVMQLALASLAWRDLAHQPRYRVRGPKRLWGLVIAVNWVGPLSYFTLGKKRRAA